MMKIAIRLGYCHEIGRKIPIDGFEAESCVELPLKDGEADYDSAKYKREYFATVEEAREWGKKMVEKDFWGSVPITPYHMEPFGDFPNIYHKEYGETIEWIER